MDPDAFLDGSTAEFVLQICPWDYVAIDQPRRNVLEGREFFQLSCCFQLGGKQGRIHQFGGGVEGYVFGHSFRIRSIHRQQAHLDPVITFLVMIQQAVR